MFAGIAAAAAIVAESNWIEQEEQSVKAKVATGVPECEARAEMLAAREKRYERDRKLAAEMRRLTESKCQPCADPLYLAAAFMFGAAIG